MHQMQHILHQYILHQYHQLIWVFGYGFSGVECQATYLQLISLVNVVLNVMGLVVLNVKLNVKQQIASNICSTNFLVSEYCTQGIPNKSVEVDCLATPSIKSENQERYVCLSDTVLGFNLICEGD